MLLKIKFYLINKLFWFKNRKIKNKNKYVLVEFTNNEFMNFALTLLSKIVSNAVNAKIAVFITSPISTPPKFTKLIYKVLGVEYNFFLYDYINKTNGRYVLEEFRTAKSKILTVDDLFKFEYNDVKIGDLLYDLVLRSGTQKATISEINDDIDDPLYAVIASICFLDEIVKNKKIVYSVFSHPTMIGGIIQRYLLLKYNICGVIGSIHTSIRKIYQLEYERNPFPGHINRQMLERIISNDKLKLKYSRLAEEFILQRTNGNLVSFDARAAYSKENEIYTDKIEYTKLLKLDPTKKNVFIALHVFNDQPNTYNSIFRDYYQWMIYTLKVISKNTLYNWIIKEHPSSIYYPTTDLNLRELVKKYYSNLTHVHFIYAEDKFNTLSVKFLADYVLTSGGSIGLESICWGIPSIICSSSFYSQSGLVTIVNNLNDYNNILQNLESLDAVSNDKIIKAKILYYLTHGVLWDDNWNNDVFFPKMTFEEKTNPDMMKIFNYYVQFLKSRESKEYIDQMIKFIQNDKSNIFFRDPELAKLEEN